LLEGHEERRAAHFLADVGRVAEHLGDAVVEDLGDDGAVVLAREEEVLGLEVAMDDGLGGAAGFLVAVGGVEACGDLLEQAQGFVDTERALLAHAGGEGLAFEQLHHEVGRLARLVETGVEHLDDEGAVDAGGDLGFELELLARAGDAHDVRKKELERHPAFGGQVLGFEDGAHAALGDAAPNAIARSESLSRLKQRVPPEPSASTAVLAVIIIPYHSSRGVCELYSLPVAELLEESAGFRP
jgi:hypothetical protein